MNDGNEQTPATDAGKEDQVQGPGEQDVAMAADGLPERLTLEDIKGAVKSAHTFRFPGTNHTVACLKLHNGFTVIGESACVRAEHFDADLGAQIAVDDALRKVWMLEGYRLTDAINQAAIRAQGEALLASVETVEAPPEKEAADA